MQANSDRRKIERIRKRIPIRFEAKGRRLMGLTMDISAGGLSIKTHQVFPPGTPLTMDLTIEGNSLSAQGEVRWAKRVPPNLVRYTHGGMGLRFTIENELITNYLQTLYPN